MKFEKQGTSRELNEGKKEKESEHEEIWETWELK